MVPTHTHHSKSGFDWLADGLAVSALLGIGWFLIGYYADFEYLATGYQDWIYHAFRIRSILEHGIVSWDHVWSNGLNYWRAYQYLPHLFVIGVMSVFHLSIGKAMLVTSVVVFLLIRVVLYALLRSFGISPLIALLAAESTYLFPQQWVVLKDYSIFISLLFVYPFLYFWIGSFSDRRHLYVATALSGFFWSIHPVLGYTLGGLLFFSVLFTDRKKEPTALVQMVLLYLLTSAAFTVPYLTVTYKFVNPIFASSQFLRDTLISDYFGLGLSFIMLFSAGAGALFIFGHRFPQWSKVLFLYCTLLLLMIRIGQEGYLPSLINQLQITRAIVILAFLLAVCFGVFFSRIASNWKSKFFTSVLLVVVVFFATSSIEVAQIYTGEPVATATNAVAEYFRNRPLPVGEVYYANVSEASTFAPMGIRFVTSYNEHLQPHPYSTRFHNLVKTDAAYAVITEKQRHLISDYALVLGIEYLFLPAYSPLIKGLVSGEDPAFTEVGTAAGDGEIFTVIRATKPTASAYAFPAGLTGQMLRFDTLPKPTLATVSYTVWDDEIARVAELIRSEKLSPLPVAYPTPETLTIDLRDRTIEHPGIFLGESFDPDWRASDSRVSIAPTSLRFMSLSLPDSSLPVTITLSHSWPKWHWPLQLAVLGIVGLILGLFLLSEIVRLWKGKN